MELLEKELSNKIIGAFYDVYNELGYGFLKNGFQMNAKMNIARNRNTDNANTTDLHGF